VRILVDEVERIRLPAIVSTNKGTPRSVQTIVCPLPAARELQKKDYWLRGSSSARKRTPCNILSLQGIQTGHSVGAIEQRWKSIPMHMYLPTYVA
jgi:hypothetical protein